MSVFVCERVRERVRRCFMMLKSNSGERKDESSLEQHSAECNGGSVLDSPRGG